MKKIESIYDLTSMIPSFISSAEVLWACKGQDKMKELWDYILYNTPCSERFDNQINVFCAIYKEEIWEALDLSQEREAERRNRLCLDSLE